MCMFEVWCIWILSLIIFLFIIKDISLVIGVASRFLTAIVATSSSTRATFDIFFLRF